MSNLHPRSRSRGPAAQAEDFVGLESFCLTCAGWLTYVHLVVTGCWGHVLQAEASALPHSLSTVQAPHELDKTDLKQISTVDVFASSLAVFVPGLCHTRP